MSRHYKVFRDSLSSVSRELKELDYLIWLKSQQPRKPPQPVSINQRLEELNKRLVDTTKKLASQPPQSPIQPPQSQPGKHTELQAEAQLKTHDQQSLIRTFISQPPEIRTIGELDRLIEQTSLNDWTIFSEAIRPEKKDIPLEPPKSEKDKDVEEQEALRANIKNIQEKIAQSEKQLEKIEKKLKSINAITKETIRVLGDQDTKFKELQVSVEKDQSQWRRQLVKQQLELLKQQEELNFLEKRINGLQPIPLPNPLGLEFGSQEIKKLSDKSIPLKSLELKKEQFLSNIKSESDFDSFLKANGLKKVDRGGGGDCQFRVLAHELLGSAEKFKEMRKFIAEEMRFHRARHIDTAQYDVPSGFGPYTTFDQYLDALENGNVWGNNNTLQACADAFGVKINCLSSMSEGTLFQIPPVDQPHMKGEILIGHEAEYHYVGLVPLLSVG
jgi:hypothetical protein